MRKKTILAICMVMLAMAGCGNAEEERDSISVSETETPGEDSSESDTEKSETEVNEANEADEKQSRAPVFTWERITDNRYSENGEMLAEYYADTVEVSGEGYEKVAPKVAEWSMSKMSDSDMDTMAQDAMEQSEFAQYDVFYSDTTQIMVERADPSLLSFCSFFYEYTGGAHGWYGYLGKTFDVATGNEMGIEDLMSNPDGFKTYARKCIYDEIQEKYLDAVFPEYDNILKEMWNENLQWYVDGNGIVIIFNIYELGPYASGEFRFSFTYEELKDYMKPEYLGVNGAGIAKITDFEMLSDELSEFAYVKSVYRIQKSSDTPAYLLVSADYASDDYVTMVFDISGAEPKLTFKSETGYDVNESKINAEKLYLRKTIYMLGTYVSDVEVVLTDDGRLEEIETIYDIQSDSSFKGIKLKQDMKAFDTDKGVDIVVPAGTYMNVDSVDIFNNVFLETESGQHIGVQCVRGTGDDEWTWFINGVSEFELFEELPYAG